MSTIDMTTAEGLYAHLSTLPTANLEAIAARPIWNAESATMAAMAGLIVDMRTITHTQTESAVLTMTEGGSKRRRVSCSCGWSQVVEVAELRMGETFVVARSVYARHAANAQKGA